ncbi:MAG: hypothetical protein KDG89_10020 [Geminicoccaceae bacterium]|nr:hypothetical protein [Geminicoccaceae bacterium]
MTPTLPSSPSRITLFVRPRSAPILGGRNVTVRLPGEAMPVVLDDAELAALLVLEAKGEVEVVKPFMPGIGGEGAAAREAPIAAAVEASVRAMGTIEIERN